ARFQYVETASLEGVGPADLIERAGDRQRLCRILVEVEIAPDPQVDVAQTNRRVLRYLDAVADQPQRRRHVQRQVQAEPVPGVERRDRVDLGDPGLLDRVGLEQRAR